MRAVIYARVSGDRQAKEATVESQLDALKRRAQADGHVLGPEDVFVDEGFSGAQLQRPALDRLRDLAAEGEIDALYVHTPDRLARKYAYQVMLIEEFTRDGVAPVFLTNPRGDGPEGELLVQIQGMFAEYEKAKILERSRRGRLHKARKGSVNVLSGAPYGYLYVKKAGLEDARFEILPDEADTVQKVFNMFVHEHLSIQEIARRLDRMSIKTPTGGSSWWSTTVWYILRNPAYAGRACFGKSTACPRQFSNRRSRVKGNPMPKRENSSQKRTDPSTWIPIEVPAIVSNTMFDAAQEQLSRNRELAKRNNKAVAYLLRGLVVCKCCSYKVHARQSSVGKYKYRYYKCPGRLGHGRPGTICDTKSIRVDYLDDAVWTNVKYLLEDPERVMSEFNRRCGQTSNDNRVETQYESLVRARQKCDSVVRRLLDGYEAGALNLTELTPRLATARAAVKKVEQQLQALAASRSESTELREIITHLSEFKNRLKSGLESLNFEERQRLVRTLIKRVEVGNETVSIVYRVTGVGHG